MNKTPPAASRIFAMVAFAFSCFGLLLFLWLSFGGSVPLKPKGYRFQVALPGGDAARHPGRRPRRRRPGRQGRRQAPRPAANLTLATIELDRKYAPLRSDARATLRQKTLLGETFVELTLGSTDAPLLEEDGRLPNDQVQPSDRDRRGAQHLRPVHPQGVPHVAAGARRRRSTGRGQDLNDSFGTLPAFVESGGDLTEALDEEQAGARACSCATRASSSAR